MAAVEGCDRTNRPAMGFFNVLHLVFVILGYLLEGIEFFVPGGLFPKGDRGLPLTFALQQK